MTTATPPKGAKRTSKVFIVDDHPIVRHGLAQLIGQEEDMEVCGEAADADEAMAKIRTIKPDVLLIDVSLQGTNGIELVKQMKAQNESLRMLVMSMHEESLFAERALRAGAMGYINKDQATTHIVSAIRQILGGKVYLSEAMAEQFLQRLVDGQHDLEQSPVDSLTDRELEIFELIGKGLTTRQIAEGLHLSVRTIETHRDNIKAKLNLQTTTELMRYAVKWVLDGR